MLLAPMHWSFSETFKPMVKLSLLSKNLISYVCVGQSVVDYRAPGSEDVLNPHEKPMKANGWVCTTISAYSPLVSRILALISFANGSGSGIEENLCISR